MGLGKHLLVAICLMVLSVATPQGMAFAGDNCTCNLVQEFEWVVETRFATGVPHRQVFRIWASSAREAEEVAERLFRNTHPRREDAVNAIASRV